MVEKYVVVFHIENSINLQRHPTVPALFLSFSSLQYHSRPNVDLNLKEKSSAYIGPPFLPSFYISVREVVKPTSVQRLKLCFLAEILNLFCVSTNLRIILHSVWMETGYRWNQGQFLGGFQEDTNTDQSSPCLQATHKY